MDNTIFFQHPDLIRSLGVHETVIQLMVKTLKHSAPSVSMLSQTEGQPPNSPTSPAEAAIPFDEANRVLTVDLIDMIIYAIRIARLEHYFLLNIISVSIFTASSSFDSVYFFLSLLFFIISRKYSLVFSVTSFHVTSFKCNFNLPD